VNESDGEYGADGRRPVKSKYAEFVDIYA